MYSESSAWQPWQDLAGRSAAVASPPLDSADAIPVWHGDVPRACMCGTDDADTQAAQQRLASLMEAASAIGPVDCAIVHTMIASAIGPVLRNIFDDPAVYAAAMGRAAERLEKVVTLLTTPTAICASPADIELLRRSGLTVLPDPDVTPGTLRVAVQDGWMEDGPSAWMDRLTVALARAEPC